MKRFSRAIELIEGDNGRISSIKVCTYMVVITLCIILLRADSEDKPSIAMIAAGLAVGREITQRTAEVKMKQAENNKRKG